MDRLGVIVNPIAGMGGRVGLKGTDGNVDRARELGAEPRAPDRAREALEAFARHRPEVAVYTAAGEMGELPASEAGFDPTIVYSPDVERTTAADTREIVQRLLEDGVDLIMFVGGDGTAADVAEVLTAQESETPMLGVPAGVKIFSSVFGVTPADAGRIGATFERVEEREVNDIDEDAYRDGDVRTTLKGVVPVPVAPEIQSGKQLARGNVDSLAAGFGSTVDSETTYVFGPGATVGAIESELDIDGSPLGVDVWRDGDMLVRDGSEREILDAIRDPTVIVVSPIGGQGFIFGRGNHQISPTVLDRASDIDIVASSEKLDGLGALRVDTDDATVNDALRGWEQVRTGRFTTRLVKVV